MGLQQERGISIRGRGGRGGRFVVVHIVGYVCRVGDTLFSLWYSVAGFLPPSPSPSPSRSASKVEYVCLVSIQDS